MSRKPVIIGVSDVSVGYGSPQVLAFMRSITNHYQTSNSILFEPDQVEIPPLKNTSFAFSIRRVATTFHPYSSGGRVEYIFKTAEEINKLKPDILVIFCTFSLPVLFRLKTKPAIVIYYSYEMTSAYGPFDVEMGRNLKGMVDLVIFPEENRGAIDIRLCGLNDIPVLVLLNSGNIWEDSAAIIPPHDRNSRILYSGVIDKKRTYAGYYLEKDIADIPIDLFGKISVSEQEEFQSKLCHGAIRYMGFVSAQRLAKLRRQYSYSIVIWNPVDEQHLYAAPNKFFESIASGVPPIAAPHPQCKMVIDRYKCGLLMEDWSFKSFCCTIQRALKIYQTEAYEELVINCNLAIERELHWEKQFEKVKIYLKEV